MKNKLLSFLMVLAASVWSLETVAQTDVTDTYLTNPSFEYSAEGTSYTGTAFTALTSGGSIYGWTLPTLGSSWNNLQINTSGGTTSSAFGTATAADGTYYFFNRQGWGSSTGTTGTLSQTSKAALPAGKYILSFQFKGVDKYDSGHTSTNSTLTLAVADAGSNTLATTGAVKMFYSGTAPSGTYFADNEWKTLCLPFTVSAEGTVTIKLTETLKGGVRSDLIVDNFKLITTDSFEDTYSSSNTLDVTNWIINPNFTGISATGWTDATGFSGNSSTGIEQYNKTFNSYQTISNIPNGKYTVTVKGFYRDGGSATDETIRNSYVYGTSAGTTTTAQLVSLKTLSATYTPVPTTYTTGVTYLTTCGDACKASADVLVTDNTLTLGVAKTVALTYDWTVFSNFTLTYQGPDLTALTTTFNGKYAELQALSTTDIPTAAATEISNAITTYATTPTTSADLTAAINAISAITSKHDALVTSYAALNAFIATCTSIQNNSTPDDGLAVDGGGTLNTFATAIATATTNKDAQTTVAGLTPIYNTLEAARQVYVVVAEPASGYPFDYTFKVTNNSFETGTTTGWTVPAGTDTGAKLNSNATYTMSGNDGSYIFNTWGGLTTYSVSQSLTGLREGLYTLSAVVASDAGNTITLTGGSSTSVVSADATSGKAVGVTGTVTGFSVTSAGTATISATSSTWFKADNFQLSFTGYDQTTALASLSALITEAGTYTTGKQMQSSVLTALNDAITAANTEYNAATHTKSTIQTVYNSLTTARDNASASATHYASLLAAITKVSATTAATALATDIATAQGVYDAQTATNDEADAAATALQTALESYASTVENSSAIDLTSYYLVNGDFSDGTNGWTKTGSFTASNTWTVASNVLTFAPASGHYTGCTTWQKVTLAAGSYKLSADVNAGALAGKTACLFAATKDPAWNNVLSDVLASRDVTTYGSYESLSVIFTLTAQTEVRLGVNAYAYNTSTGAYASYSVKNFKLEQAKNETVTVNGTTTATGTWTAAEIAAIPVTTNIKALDLTAVSIPASTTVTVTSNPNCLIYAADASNLTNSSNVVAAGACAKLVVADGYPFVPTTSFTTSDATYNRSVYTDGGWETFCSPIATEAQEGYTYEEFTSYASNQATFTAISGTTLAANTPYIMKKTTGSGTAGSTTALTLTNTTAQTISAPAASTLEFRGTLVPYTVSAAEVGKVYKMKADGSGFNQAKENGVIPAFRGYLYLTSGGSGIVIRHEGLTAIDGITVDGNAPADVYTLDGRLLRKNVKAAQAVQGLEKGIYVVNGKKIVVK